MSKLSHHELCIDILLLIILIIMHITIIINYQLNNTMLWLQHVTKAMKRCCTHTPRSLLIMRIIWKYGLGSVL